MQLAESRGFRLLQKYNRVRNDSLRSMQIMPIVAARAQSPPPVFLTQAPR
jgi:hypothetical protein